MRDRDSQSVALRIRGSNTFIYGVLGGGRECASRCGGAPLFNGRPSCRATPAQPAASGILMFTARLRRVAGT